MSVLARRFYHCICPSFPRCSTCYFYQYFRSSNKVNFAWPNLSKSNFLMLALAHAMLGKPRLLILDEPGNGLDPQGMRDIRALLASLPAQTRCTVFMSSHQLDEVEKIATHVAVLHDGRVLCQQAVPQLVRSHSGILTLEVDDSGRAQAVLARHGYPARCTGAGHLEVSLAGAYDSAPLHAALVGAGIALYQSVFRKPTLEQWFIDLIHHEEARDACDAVQA